MKNFKFKINNISYNIEINEVVENIIKLQVNGQSYEVEMENPIPQPTQPIVTKQKIIPTVKTNPIKSVVPKAGAAGNVKVVKSPLPGVILSIKVKEGDAISKGTVVVIMEAMKMENNIQSEFEGTIISVKVKEGQSVLQDEILIEVEN